MDYLSRCPIPPSDNAVSLSIIDTTSTIVAPAKEFVKPVLESHDVWTVPAYAFLIRNLSQNRTIIFDLGVRKDFDSLAPGLVQRIKASGFAVKTEKGAIIWSHCHFDHTGDPSSFDAATALVVGPGVKANLMPGYPTNPESGLLDSDWAGREVMEINFDNTGLKIGQFQAHDYFGDGSFYLLDAPGHAIGHMCALARVTSHPPSFVFLGADSAHHGAELRPSKWMTLPSRLSFSNMPQASFCPGDLFEELVPGADKTKPMYRLTDKGSHFNAAVAEETIAKIQELDALDNVFVTTTRYLSAIAGRVTYRRLSDSSTVRSCISAPREHHLPPGVLVSRPPADKLATLACASEAAPRRGRAPSSTGASRLKDEGTRLQVVSAGAIAGLVSRFVVSPLDVVKIRLQLQPHSPSAPAPLRGTVATIKHILKHEGLTALWKGNVPAELLYVCYASIQFSAYRATTLFLQTGLPTRLPDAAESFLAGASSGALATTITYPLDLLRTRFAAQGRTKIYASLRRAVLDIKRDEGLRGFFRGIGPGLAQIVPLMGIFFVAYEGLRVRLAGLNMPWGGGDATAGVAGSVIAKTIVFPLDLVRKRIQVQGPTRGRYVYNDIPEYSSTLRAISSIVRAEGIRGLYKGLPISLIKSAPAGAVTVWTYERSLKVLMGWDAKEARL
ncbi:hypothetical protein EsHS_00000221 [Epichloe bromicola]